MYITQCPLAIYLKVHNNIVARKGLFIISADDNQDWTLKFIKLYKNKLN